MLVRDVAKFRVLSSSKPNENTKIKFYIHRYWYYGLIEFWFKSDGKLGGGVKNLNFFSIFAFKASGNYQCKYQRPKMANGGGKCLENSRTTKSHNLSLLKKK